MSSVFRHLFLFFLNPQALEGCLIAQYLVFYHEQGQGTKTLASNVLAVQSGQQRCW